MISWWDIIRIECLYLGRQLFVKLDEVVIAWKWPGHDYCLESLLGANLTVCDLCQRFPSVGRLVDVLRARVHFLSEVDQEERQIVEVLDCQVGAGLLLLSLCY